MYESIMLGYIVGGVLVLIALTMLICRLTK